MRTLLTGATGFVGAAVLRTLVAAGHDVRVLVRPGSDRQNLSGIDCEIITGDLAEPESLRHAVRGCEALFHVAADYRLWVPDPERMYRVNVEGTAISSGPPRRREYRGSSIPRALLRCACATTAPPQTRNPTPSCPILSALTSSQSFSPSAR